MKESISCLADALSMLEREREGDRETERHRERVGDLCFRKRLF